MFGQTKKHSLILLLLFLAGCTDGSLADRPADAGGELPVEFEFALPPRTRAFDGEVKKSFVSGDVIHIIGTFETRELQEDGEYKEGKLKRYGAMSYNGKTWEPLAGSNLTWPSVSVNGTFEAYYIYGSNGVLTDATTPEPIFLAGIDPAKGDPMHAESEKEIVYGHAVKLDFEHLCAYLTLVDLEPQVSTAYWFTRDEGEPFHNAFTFDLKKDESGDPKFAFEFCAKPSEKDFPDLICIAAEAKGETVFDDSGMQKTITKASYFLEPGYYETFSICYPGADKVFKYLQYDYNKVPEESGGVGKENSKPDLAAGRTYTLTITKAPGVIIDSPSSGEGWHDGSPYYELTEKQVEDFLKAVAGKQDYDIVVKENGEERTVHILETTAEGTRLLENLDFQYFLYFDYEKKSSKFDSNFVPNIDEGNVFDGDYHYIKHLGSPLFRYNYGTVKNIGIQEVNIEATTYEDDKNYDDHNKDMSRIGALCMWNRGTVNNVRVKKVTMTVSVDSQIEPGVDGSETHNIGCVAGSNTGSISEVAMSGEFVLTVSGTNANASVLIGGILGQNAAGGTVSGVTPLEADLTILITNQCTGEIGSYSVGGVVGESTGILSGIILSDVTIDGSDSQGVTSYMGGIAGQLAVSAETDGGASSTAFVDACIISGSVTAGKTDRYGAITSGSYIGSIAGADLNVPVTDCRTAVSVHGSEVGNENVIYAAGGAFGRIRDAENYRFEDLIVYGSALDGPHDSDKKQFVGNFAGIVPLGQTWEKDYASGNILLRKLAEKNIGGNLDSNNSE